MKISLKICILLLPFFSLSQNPIASTTAGEKILSMSRPFNFLVQEHDGKVYTVAADKSSYFSRAQNRDVYMHVYDGETLELLHKQTIRKFKFQGEKTFLLEVVGNDKGVHLLYSAIDKQANVKYLVHVRVSHNGDIYPARKIAEFRGLDKVKGEFLFYNSENKATTMVYEQVFEDGVTVRTPEVTLLDDEFNKIWRGEMKSPFPNSFFVPVQMEVSKAGELFVMGFAKNRPDEPYRDARKTRSYGLVRVFKDEEPMVFSFYDEGKIIHSLAIEADYHGQLLVTGFYADSAGAPVKGSFYGLMDQSTLGVKELSMRKFDEAVFAHLQEDDRNGVEKKLGRMFNATYRPEFQGLDHMDYKDFVKHPDGGVVVVAERQYRSSDFRKWTPGNTIYSYYEEIALFYFDKAGELEWLKIIPKLQIVSSGMVASYFLLESENGINLLFNDNPDNLRLRANQQPIKALNEGALGANMEGVCVQVDWNGNAHYAALESKHTKKVALIPDAIIEAGEKEGAIAYLFKGTGGRYWFQKFIFN